MAKAIDHFLHSHPLVLNDGKESRLIKFGSSCQICPERLYFPFYECTECYYGIHKSCAQHPKEIQSFFHPCPLSLTVKDSYWCHACSGYEYASTYRCERCDFNMHVRCAQRPNVESEELVQHFIHWHPLKLVDPNKHLEVECRICYKFFSASDSDSGSSAYGCQRKDCDFFVHNSCMTSIPQRINHSSHPSCPLILRTSLSSYECKGCDEAGSGLAFSCAKCRFQLHVKCTLTEDTIQHASHNHLLVLRESKEIDHEVRCKACGENCLLDPCFCCIKRSCHFFLHKKCAYDLQPEIHHPFHSLHPLALLRDLSYHCEACDEDGSGLAYCCEECKFRLDHKCAFFPTIESQDADKVLHGSHKHPLALYESNELGDEVRCRSCAKSCLTPCFGCTDCNFFLHKTCAVESQEKNIRHPFHPVHPLTLSSPPPLPLHDTFQCSSCLGSVDCNLLHYRCAKCDFNLHIDCAKPKLKVPVGHIHGLTYFDRTCAPVQCSICHEDAQTAFFRCVACGFNIHIYCIPSTPKTITHGRHSHPLTVTKSPFEFELISPRYADRPEDEFFCDVCEKKRYKFESVYYCADCKYIAEVRCVLSELLPSLMISKDQRTVEGKVVSIYEESYAIEATIENLNSKIARSKKERRALKGKVEAHRGKLKSFEDQLERKKSELRKLKTDNFFYKYRLNHDMKEHEKPAEASMNLSSREMKT